MKVWIMFALVTTILTKKSAIQFIWSLTPKQINDFSLYQNLQKNTEEQYEYQRALALQFFEKAGQEQMNLYSKDFSRRFTEYEEGFIKRLYLELGAILGRDLSNISQGNHENRQTDYQTLSLLKFQMEL